MTIHMPLNILEIFKNSDISLGKSNRLIVKQIFQYPQHFAPKGKAKRICERKLPSRASVLPQKTAFFHYITLHIFKSIPSLQCRFLSE